MLPELREHYMKSPEQLGAAETKVFILHLIRDRQASRVVGGRSRCRYQILVSSGAEESRGRRGSSEAQGAGPSAGGAQPR